MKSEIKSVCIAAGIAEAILLSTAAALIIKYYRNKHDRSCSPCDNTGEQPEETFWQNSFD